MSTGIVKELQETTQNKKKTHNKSVMSARSKLNSIESKITEALINNEIGHEDFMTIINEEKTIKNERKALEWWKVKELILKKLIWSKKVRKLFSIIWSYFLLSA